MAHLSRTAVAVIGAGPYGLSVAAHLRSAGVDFRIFGRPMYRWEQQMPRGMCLKSDGRASSLSDPDARYTLGRYCVEHGLPYSDRFGNPIPLELFTQYARWFRQNLALNVEEVMVTKVD